MREGVLYRFVAMIGVVTLAILSSTGRAVLAQTNQTSAEEIDPLPSYIDPHEIRRGVPMGGEPGKSREQSYYERSIRLVEPGIKGSPEKLPVYLAAFQREFIADSKLFPFSVQAEILGDGSIHLKGYVGYQENRVALLKYLSYMGFENVTDEIEALPSRSLGDRLFAFVNVPYCFSYDRPEGRREPMNQGLIGDPIFQIGRAHV